DLLVRCPGFALIGLDLGEAPPRLPLTLAFRLKFAVERTETALLIVSRRRVAGSGASLVVETERKAIAWVGPGPVPTRLAAARTSARVLRARRPPAEARDSSTSTRPGSRGSTATPPRSADGW